ncbi:MAG: thiolase family protein [Hyphomicrobiaceae bacterium]
MVPEAEPKAYIVAARRTALGRIGGLHRTRRVEALAAPVISALLDDAKLDATKVDEIIVGNATAGGNPARLVALAAGLPETINASTVDQQDASGLVAIIQAMRLVGHGDANIVIAGGAESISTAPWRVARPRNAHQMPHFISPEPLSQMSADRPIPVEATEQLARTLRISRHRQDAFTASSMERAIAARKAQRFADEIVPLRARIEEARDQSTEACDIDELSEELPFQEDDGTLTPANTSTWHDGAAFVIVVSKSVWEQMGQPPALSLLANAALGVTPGREALAPIAAVEKMYNRLNGFDRASIRIVETSETSAAQAVALAEALGLDETSINPEGGALARGHPFGAAGAVLVVRLFSQLVRNPDTGRDDACGIATQSALGGLGVAALFSSTGSS